MRFVFSPPAGAASGLLTLPWREPLTDWQDERLVEIPRRGLSRHVVRFAAEGGVVYALKELDERLARKEYRLLRRLAELGVPAVEAMGVAVSRPAGLDAILVTRFLDYSSCYRALFASPRGGDLAGRLLDALVELLVRLHLAGFMWGDCSLSNTLFRFDAGAFAAYLVDAETSEMHPSLTDGQRIIDLGIAQERVLGDLLDLQFGGLLPADVDPDAVAEETVRRYRALWAELTGEDILRPAEQRYRIEQRLRRINDLGFDVEEVELVEAGEGSRLRLRTRVAEPGHHRRVLFARTGLMVGENQARRLLNDIASYRGHLERVRGGPVPEVAAASRWLSEVYEPVVRAIPPALRGRLPDAEIFHEVLEHRWLMSEAAGRDIGTTAAASDYFATILPEVPDELTVAPPALTGRDGPPAGPVWDSPRPADGPTPADRPAPADRPPPAPAGTT